nr:MAG TPA: hypothetical protein [Crassvirales sp.]
MISLFRIGLFRLSLFSDFYNRSILIKISPFTIRIFKYPSTIHLFIFILIPI